MLATNNRAGLRGRQLQGQLLTFALDSEADALRASARSASDGLASKTLIRQGPLRITLLTLRQGATLNSHTVEAPSSIQVLRGKLRITTDHGDVVISDDGMVTLAAGVIHSATALSDCAVLLTIVKV
jgi:quercetin dioxygenase-like cupin family protein